MQRVSDTCPFFVDSVDWICIHIQCSSIGATISLGGKRQSAIPTYINDDVHGVLPLWQFSESTLVKGDPFWIVDFPSLRLGHPDVERNWSEWRLYFVPFNIFLLFDDLHVT